MRILFSIFFCVGLLANSFQLNAHVAWSTDYSAALQQSSQTSKPVLIFFTGTGWCSWCTKLEREVLDTPEFSQAVGQRFIFMKANFPNYGASAVQSSPYKPLLDRYQVSGFPAIVVVNSNGEKLFSMGYEAGGGQAYSQKLVQKLGQFK